MTIIAGYGDYGKYGHNSNFVQNGHFVHNGHNIHNKSEPDMGPSELQERGHVLQNNLKLLFGFWYSEEAIRSANQN